MFTEQVGNDRLLTLAETMSRLRVSRGTFQRMLRAGNGPRICKIGPRTLRVPESCLQEFLQARMAQ